MNTSIYNIPIPNLLLLLIPVALVIFIYAKWSLNYKTVAYATVRMLIQLLLIGFFLVYIFENDSWLVMTAILGFMLTAAAWIATRPLGKKRKGFYSKVLLSLSIGCVTTLALVVFGVIRLDPWYEPRYLIPIAGMIFANAMNSVSLAAERFQVEIEREPFEAARGDALGASLLPLLNSFFAVGLVSLPGMMTGQILAGISPLIAVRYQVMVMCMLLGASGISAAVYLQLQKNEH